MEISSANKLDEVRFAFSYFEYANKFQAQNFLFLAMNFMALIFTICLLMGAQFISVFESFEKIAFGIMPVLPSFLGMILCVAWFYHKRRHNTILRSIYSNLIDLYQTVDGAQPFLFHVQRGFGEKDPVSLSQLWNYVIVLMLYLHALVVFFGMRLSFLRIVN